MAKPFNELKGKKEWKWNNEHQKAFEKLKNKITSKSVLVLSKKKEKFRVKTNTSEYTIKEILFQKQEEK